jgi:hypothetical protein
MEFKKILQDLFISYVGNIQVFPNRFFKGSELDHFIRKRQYGRTSLLLYCFFLLLKKKFFPLSPPHTALSLRGVFVAQGQQLDGSNTC